MNILNNTIYVLRFATHRMHVLLLFIFYYSLLIGFTGGAIQSIIVRGWRMGRVAAIAIAIAMMVLPIVLIIKYKSRPSEKEGEHDVFQNN